jgi:hypothetical protein
MLENAKPHQHSPPASEPGGPLSPCGRGLRRLTSALVSRSWVRGCALSVTHHAAFVQMETQRQYNLAQRRKGAKKVSARPVIGQSTFGDDAIVIGVRNNSSPARGSRRRCGATAGPSQTVEGHVQGITTPDGQDNQSAPLQYASHNNLVHCQRTTRLGR